MIQLSKDGRVAEREMHAIIYYLTAFGYIDGDFDPSEKLFIRKYIEKLVFERAKATGGAASADVLARWTEHFHEVLDEVDGEIQSYFTESVSEGEETRDFVLAKLKLRCFELFKGFDEENRASLLGSIDELMMADGVVHPNEKQFRDDLVALIMAPIEIDDQDIELVDQGGVVITGAQKLEARQVDHPFFKSFEVDYATDPATFAKQAKTDLEIIHRFEAKLAEQRVPGGGKLEGAKDFKGFAGQPAFLDRHVYVLQPTPAEAFDVLVIGDLHGCYSCLKAALMQADFFAKVEAWNGDRRLPKPLLVFLGDYIDRGKFSYSGVLRTVMQIFLAAPDHVFVLRGNHEYYIELKGRVLAPVRPSEAMTSLQSIAPNEVFAEYMRLFEVLPTSLVLGSTLFVHAGIPREDTIQEKIKDAGSLNDPDVRFQMLWSDPSEADAVPLDLQKANARFPFGKKQWKSFMNRFGLTTLIRGHERVVEGFRKIYDEDGLLLLSLFSAGGAENEDLPKESNYRQVTPMALTIKVRDGVSELTPFAIAYEQYNDPKYNSFFREKLPAP